MRDLDQSDIQRWFTDNNVSRETIEKLAWFVGELEKWTKKVNLVAPGSLRDIWDRHILDSAQLISFLRDDDKKIVDLGSGGGLPVIPLAILDRDSKCGRSFVSIESDKRKAAFQAHVVRSLSLNVEVRAERIEEVEPQNADVALSRALANLSKLVGLSQRHLKTNGRMIFLKGKNAVSEVDAALEIWRFSHQRCASLSSDEAAILTLTNVAQRSGAG